MMKINYLITLLSVCFLSACTGGGAMSVAGHRVGGIHPDSCNGYEQSKKNIDALLKYAEKLQVEGKISSEKMIEVDQEAGIYSQKLTAACSFFKAGDITFEQYQDAVEKADANYRSIRESLFQASKK